MDHKLVILSVLCTIILTTDGACPNGWTRYNDSCYSFKDNDLSWHDAKNACIDMHAHVARIRTAAENNFLIQSLTERHFKDDAAHYNYWIDGNDMNVEGEWLWDNGEKPTFFDWAPNEPNNVNDEDCLTLRGAAGFHWNDYPCTRQYEFICEIEDPLDGAHQPVVG